MKKLLTFFLTALLAFSVGWATTVTFVGGTDKGSTTNTSSDSMTKNGITISSTSAGLAYSEYRFYNGTITISSTVGDITSVVFTCTSNSYANILGGSTASTGSLSTNGTTVTWTGTSSSFTIKNTAQTRASQIVVTTSGGGPVEENWYRKVTSTSDLAAGKKYIIVNEANGVGMGELNSNRFGTGVTGLTFDDNRVDIGGTNVMEMTLGGSSNNWTFQMTDEKYLSNSNSSTNAFFSSSLVNSPSDDITKWTITPSADACDIQSNYVTAQYIRFNSSGLFGTYGANAQSDVALYVQDDGTAGVANISEALAITGTTFRFTGNAVVTYQNGNNLWIRDNSGSGLIYGSVNDTFSNGDVLTAGWTATNTTSTQGVPQFGSPSGVASSTNSGTVAPEALTTLSTTDVNKYASISNITITSSNGSNYYYEVNGIEYCVRNHFNLVTLTVGKTYNVVGVVSIYNNQPQLYLISAEELAVPTILVNPATLTINDSGTGNSLTITGENVSGNINASLATNDGWYLNPNTFGNTGGTATVTYNGRALSASNTVTATATGATDASATVNYIADLYIVTDNGVTGNWDFTTGTPMTYNNGVYTASFTANVANTFILFARKLGNGVDWNTRYVFGPDSSGDWWLPTSGNGDGNIDLNDDDPIKIQTAGTYIITIDATSSPVTFTITKEVVNTGDFVLVTDDSQLNTGDEVIIVNSGTAGGARTMGQRNNNNYYGTEVTVSATQKVAATESTQIFTLEAGTGGWYFKTSDDLYLNSTTGTSNQLQTKAKDGNGTGTSLAAISISSDIATIQFQGQGNRKYLRYNANGITTNPSNNDIFSCYQSGSQDNVYLYKREASVQEPSITVNPSSLDLVIPVSESSVSGTVTVTETNTTGTTSVSINGDTNIFSATLENGTLTVTYNGNATMTSPDVATITLTNGDATATVNVTGYKRTEASGTLYSKVTNANQIQDGLQYIIVFENTTENNLNLGGPQALNGVNGGGTGTTVEWEEQGSIINISGTNAIKFTLNGNASSATLSYTSGSTTYYLEAGSAPSLDLQEDNPTEGYDWSIANNNNGYYLQWTNSNQVYTLRYNTGMSAADRFRLYTGGTGQIAYLYVQGSAVATPVINPASGRYSEDQEVTITCATTGATIYYTVNGGETQTYDGPFTVDVDEDHTTTTIAAWAEDGEQHHSPTVTVTYTYKKDHVSSIAEFLALDNGEEVIFDNPVVVLFDYSQNSSGGQEYIWIKDRTSYTQLFITPQFDAASVADPQYDNYGQFVPKYENGDVIPAGFKVKKNFYETGQYVQALCTDTHSTFQEATAKALADPEQVTLSELLANPANYNNRYLYINKLQVSNVDGLNFRIATDENGDNVSEVQGGSAIVGYNKYNSPAWKNKNGEVVGVTLPTDNNFYNVKFIFQKWDNGYEIMPIEFTLWEETSLLLEDLVQVGVEGQPYTISNQLHAVAVTWDSEKDMFAIFAKDDGMYANKRYPATGQDTYLIRYENQNGTFINEVEQEDYDQSNWIEILIPSTITQVTSKTTDVNAYIQELGNLQSTFENKILNAGSVRGTYVNALNPTIEVTALPTVASLSTYEPNIYCTANFLMENLDTDGAQGNDGNYFMMDAKPHEFCKVVWAYYDNSNGNYFVIPAREGNVVNGHGFTGSFMANMSLCEDYQVYYDFNQIRTWFLDSNDESYNGQQTLYGFDAIIRKNPNANNSNGAPRRIQPGTGDFEQTPAYIVYPLNAGGNSNDNVVGVKEVLGNKAIESVHYYNMMGMEGKTPFEGINIVVTRYTDGSTSTIKVMK